MMLSPIPELKVLSAVAVSSGFASFGGALAMLMQDSVLSPDTVLMPLGVVVGLFVASITATVKIVRALDNWLSRMGRVEERVSQLEETHEEE